MDETDTDTMTQEHWLSVYHAEYRKLKNQARFIQEIIDGDLIVGKKKKAILVKELRERKYEAFPRGVDANKKTLEDEINQSDKDDDEDDAAAGGGSRDYDYLLSVRYLFCYMGDVYTNKFVDADLLAYC